MNLNMTPREIVEELDRHIIGQKSAKRAVANALRSRWRRAQIAEPLRSEITPKNILMIGPTGVGKTEIARRLAKLANAPFIKVEATKFTEVGYVGRDVDSIIRDLVKTALELERERARQNVAVQAREQALERVLDVLVPRPHSAFNDDDAPAPDNAARRTYRERILREELNDMEIEIELQDENSKIEFLTPNGMEEIGRQLEELFARGVKQKKNKRSIKIKDALEALSKEESEKLLNREDLQKQAIKNAEQNGIVFIDEFDKIAKSGEYSGEVSREGVQRDLLPLIEGSSVSTQYGLVKTDHILFIASGAFHVAKPSDLIPEMQGRLPVRVELQELSVEDFKGILLDTEASLVKQYIALFATENIHLRFSDDAIDEIAAIAYRVNQGTENIGARRLYTIMERLTEQLSFEAPDKAADSEIVIDAAYVKNALEDLAANQDLSRYVL